MNNKTLRLIVGLGVAAIITIVASYCVWLISESRVLGSQQQDFLSIVVIFVAGIALAVLANIIRRIARAEKQ